MTLLLSLRVMALLALVATGSLLPFNFFLDTVTPWVATFFVAMPKQLQWDTQGDVIILHHHSINLLLPPAAFCFSAFTFSHRHALCGNSCAAMLLP